MKSGLESGKVGGVGLDVHWTEPIDPNDWIAQHERQACTLMPYVLSAAKRAPSRYGERYPVHLSCCKVMCMDLFALMGAAVTQGGVDAARGWSDAAELSQDGRGGCCRVQANRKGAASQRPAGTCAKSPNRAVASVRWPVQWFAKLGCEAKLESENAVASRQEPRCKP